MCQAFFFFTFLLSSICVVLILSVCLILSPMVTRRVRASCGPCGPPTTRWPTWCRWTWSSTPRWPPPGTLEPRCTTGPTHAHPLMMVFTLPCRGPHGGLTTLSVNRPKNIMVYNCTTGGINPFRWGEVGKLCFELIEMVILFCCCCFFNLWK